MNDRPGNSSQEQGLLESQQPMAMSTMEPKKRHGTMDKLRTFKVCLCGKKDVGKTSIFNVLRGKPFVEGKPKAEIQYHDHIVNVNGNDVKLQVWDTAGMEEYNSLTENYYRSAKAIIVVFSIASAESFECVQPTVQDVKEHDYAPDAHFFLVGNKFDIQIIDHQVSEERIDNILENEPRKFRHYLKTSAKTGKGITQILDKVAHTLVYAHARPNIQQGNLISDRYKDESPCCFFN